jgi:hypothetical protein
MKYTQEILSLTYEKRAHRTGEETASYLEIRVYLNPTQSEAFHALAEGVRTKRVIKEHHYYTNFYQGQKRTPFKQIAWSSADKSSQVAYTKQPKWDDYKKKEFVTQVFNQYASSDEKSMYADFCRHFMSLGEDYQENYNFGETTEVNKQYDFVVDYGGTIYYDTTGDF